MAHALILEFVTFRGRLWWKNCELANVPEKIYEIYAVFADGKQVVRIGFLNNLVRVREAIISGSWVDIRLIRIPTTPTGPCFSARTPLATQDIIPPARNLSVICGR